MRHTVTTSRVFPALAVAAAGVGLAAPGAHADDGTVRVAAPAGGALITSSNVPVVLKLGPKVTRIKLYVGGRDVSARVRLQGRVATASIPRSVVRPGANRLLVESYAGKKRIGAARRRVLVGTAFPGLVTVRSGAAARSAVEDGPGKAKRYAPQPGSLPVAALSKAPTFATLSINGHRVYDLCAGRARAATASCCARTMRRAATRSGAGPCAAPPRCRSWKPATSASCVRARGRR